MRLETDHDGRPIVVPGVSTTGRNPAVFTNPPKVPIAGDILNEIRSDGQVTPMVFVPFVPAGSAYRSGPDRMAGQANGGQWVPLANSGQISLWNPLDAFPATSMVLANDGGVLTLWLATDDIPAGQPMPGTTGAPAGWSPISPSVPVEDTRGFTYVAEAAPTPRREGDTWWDAKSGASFIALVTDDQGSLDWVQFAPGAGGGGGSGPRGLVAAASLGPAYVMTAGEVGLPGNLGVPTEPNRLYELQVSCDGTSAATPGLAILRPMLNSVPLGPAQHLFVGSIYAGFQARFLFHSGAGGEQVGIAIRTSTAMTLGSGGLRCVLLDAGPSSKPAKEIA